MRQAEVLMNKHLAGVLTETDDKKYIFHYDKDYLLNPLFPAISLAFPRSHKEYTSDHLFPFFFNMLAEGKNKAVQCRMLKIDEEDNFGLLLATAKYDSIGAITIKEL